MSKRSKTTVQNAPLSPEEQALVGINTQLAQEQLKNLQSLAPFQKELLELTMADLRRQGAISGAVTPEQEAAAAKAEFERSQRLGPIQDEILQMQLEEMRRGGAASPEQLARIKEATDRGIEAGSADIDLQTQRGIGLISDELANARGLRMTDTPILREATLLARSAEDQKASLIKNLRAGEATAALNFPLAASQIQSGINLNTQALAQGAAQFQNDLRNRAVQNRMAMTGQTANFGIGLTGRGAMFGPQSRGSTTSSSPGFASTLGGIGMAAAGIGALAPYFAAPAATGMLAAPASAYATSLLSMSDRRLKHDYGVVGKTDSGIPLHLYHYKNEDERDPLRLGVMADEVERVKPGAVKRHSSGYLAVDLAKLFDSDGIGLVPA